MAKCSPARKARLRARREVARAEEERLCAILRRDGHSCATCLHSSNPFALGKMACDLDSDFHGYATVAPTNVCSRFTSRPERTAP